MNLIKKVATYFEYVGWFCFIAMVAVMTVGTVMRYIFRSPLLFQVDVARGLLVVLCCLCFPSVFLAGGHIRVDIVTRRLPKRVQDWLWLFAELLTMVFTTFLVIVFVPLISHSLDIGAGSEVIGIPLAPLQICAAIGFGFFTLVVLVDFCKRCEKLFKSEKSINESKKLWN
ncbi:hypothetical protein ES708_05626 [subsurface metagenome]